MSTNAERYTQDLYGWTQAQADVDTTGLAVQALVSSTARYDASSCAVSVENGSGVGGGVSRTVTLRISTRSVAST